MSSNAAIKAGQDVFIEVACTLYQERHTYRDTHVILAGAEQAFELFAAFCQCVFSK